MHSHNPQSLVNAPQDTIDQCLVCGLGGLGQQCVAALKEFKVKVTAIDKVQPQYWEINDLPNLLDKLIIGDCRQKSVLAQAEIAQCRAVIIVTSDEQVNAQTALAVRKLTPVPRIVIRSERENFNQLLTEHLGDFLALEPIQQPAIAFALAALGTETKGFFYLERQWLRVVEQKITPSDDWCQGRRLYELESRHRRILECKSNYRNNLGQLNQNPIFDIFHQWEPNALVKEGDTLVYIETAEYSLVNQTQEVTPFYRQQRQSLWSKIFNRLTLEKLLQGLRQFWSSPDSQLQVRRVAVVCGLIVLLLWLIGTVLIYLYYRDEKTTLLSSFYATAILLLGGYGDLLGDFKPVDKPLPWWLQLFCLVLTLAGTAFVGVLYALLTELLLSKKFQLNKRRPPIPQRDHIIVIGMRRVGQQVASLLLELKQPFVGITLDADFDETILPAMPLLSASGRLKPALAKANLAAAKSVIIGSEDEMLNLEIGLMARVANPNCRIVIRTFEQGLSENLASLLPQATVLCAYALSAEAFAGAAFGENIISLFRLGNQTILVTEYQVDTNPTLAGLLLSEVAYGYGVVPVLYQKLQASPCLMPSDDLRLDKGDRLIVLGTIDGLRRLEFGKLGIAPKTWRVQVEKALTQEALFEGANMIARISGCDLSAAKELMNNLPGRLQSPLYKHQGQRLVWELTKAQVTASLVPIV
ncbi:NAD-binding protein [Lyngbya aestuarii]|uniref:NAD-binding protein n=1 Tax=Lyngbya aestuarii TaxID=118322 RepID=UPI00403DFDA6